MDTKLNMQTWTTDNVTWDSKKIKLMTTNCFSWTSHLKNWYGSSIIIYLLSWLTKIWKNIKLHIPINIRNSPISGEALTEKDAAKTCRNSCQSKGSTLQACVTAFIWKTCFVCDIIRCNSRDFEIKSWNEVGVTVHHNRKQDCQKCSYKNAYRA